MIPRFCPNFRCVFHHRIKPPPRFYDSAGTYETLAFGTVPRYRCKLCGKYFSDQTFSIDYYTKRPISYRQLLEHLITTSSIRDMARSFSVSVDVVLNKLERLARNSLVVLEQLEAQVSLHEDLVTDGFETFTVSQFFPCHINLLAGADSQLMFATDYVTIRRKGRMTEEQKRIREQLERLWKADPKGIEKSMKRLFALAAQLIGDGATGHVQIRSDKHQAYPRALNGCDATKALLAEGRIDHLRIDSTKARTPANPLFTVNYLDRQFRKDLSEHVRETVCFGRNVNRAMDRMTIYTVYHNLKKAYREVKGDFRTHAEVVGIPEREVKRLLSGMYTKRAFATKVKLGELRRTVWYRRHVTPLKAAPERLPKHAVAV